MEHDRNKIEHCDNIPCKSITRKKKPVMIMAEMVALDDADEDDEDDDGDCTFAAFIFLITFMRSILSCFLLAIFVISLSNLISAASRTGPFGGRGGLAAL